MIDNALANGGSIGFLHKKYDLSESALKRHRKDHMTGNSVSSLPMVSDDLGADYEKLSARIKTGQDVIDFATMLLMRTERIVDKSEASGDYRTALQGISAMQKTLVELFAKTTGLLADAPTTQNNVLAVVLRDASEEQLRAFLARGVGGEERVRLT